MISLATVKAAIKVAAYVYELVKVEVRQARRDESPSLPLTYKDVRHIEDQKKSAARPFPLK